MRAAAVLLAGILALTASAVTSRPAAAADPIPTTTTVQADPATAEYGDTVTYTVTVAPAPPDGSLVLLDRTTDDGYLVTSSGLALNGGVANTFEEIWPPGGPSTLTATFEGAGDYAPSVGTTPFEVLADPYEIGLSAARQNDWAIVPGAEFELRAYRSDSMTFGSFSFYETTGGADTFLGLQSIQQTEDGVLSRIYLNAANATAGVHTYEARYQEYGAADSGSATLELIIAPVPTTTELFFVPNPVEEDAAPTASVRIRNHGTNFVRTGSISIVDVASGSTVATLDATNPVGPVPARPEGTYAYRAVYGGDIHHAASTSTNTVLTVATNTVHASGVEVAYATFYPIVDGYLDRNLIRGTREEPAVVAIRIYSPSGPLIRKVTLAMGSGFYSWKWNGRNAAGTMQPPGRYRVTQTFTDAASASRRFTTYTTISHKKLVYKTSSYVRNASLYSARSTTGTVASYGDGSVQINNAAVGWHFKLPPAVTYQSLSFWARGQTNGFPQGQAGVWNFYQCPFTSGAWPVTCFHSWKTLGSATSWTGVTMSTTADRLGQSVRGAVVGYARVYQVKVVVTYGVLQ